MAEVLYRRRGRSWIESLESRQLLASTAGPILLDAAAETTPIAVPALQIADRWVFTASGFTGQVGNGITLAYSIVPDGTVLPSEVGEGNSGSSLRAKLDARYGSINTWLPIVQSVFNRWSAVSGVTYVYEPRDDGLPVGAANLGLLGTRGDIRIGAHPIDGSGSIGAYGILPYFGGDMVLDADDLVSGLLTDTSNNSLALRNVIAHENGHNLGLAHVVPVDGTKLMEPVINLNFDGPQFDDILAVQHNYGDVNEKGAGNDMTDTATDLGTLAAGATKLASQVSISTTSDSDYYQFTIASPQSVTINVTPVGPTYLQGGEGYTPALFNASAQMDLQATLSADDFSITPITRNATGVGGSETISYADLPAGTYFVRVSSAPGALNSTQMYSLTATAAGGPTTTVAINSSGQLTVTDTSSAEQDDALTFAADTANNVYVITDPNNLLATSIAGASGNSSHTVAVPFSAVTGGRVIINTLAGNDSIIINSTKVFVNVNGGAGTDTITVNGTAAGGAVLLYASAGNDTINVNTDNAGTASLFFNETQTVGAINIGNGGTATVSYGPLVFSGITINPTGTLDLTNSSAILDYTGTSPLATLRGYMKSGYGNGSWQGAGIRSSTAPAQSLASIGFGEATSQYASFPATFAGKAIDATSILFFYTLAGDVSLDRTVDSADFARILAGFGTTANVSFARGDLNYDGLITSTDFSVFASEYGNTLASVAALPAAAASPFATDTDDDQSFLESVI